MTHRILAAIVVTLLGAPLPAAKVVELEPEVETTVHIGEIAVMRVPTKKHYSVGHAGESLRLVKRARRRGTTVYRYRAIAAGHQTFVLTPRESGPDGCISCVTVHYFINVVE